MKVEINNVEALSLTEVVEQLSAAVRFRSRTTRSLARVGLNAGATSRSTSWRTTRATRA